MAWVETTIGNLVTFQRGHDLPESARQQGTIPVVGSAGINGFHNKARAKAPCVTMGRSGASIGKTFFINEDFWPHNACLFVKDFKGNNPHFIYYFLSSVDFSHLNSGSAQPSLNRNILHAIKAKVPSTGIQRKIAAILSAYDELIENNRRRIGLLERMAEELYREWFVRFRFPNHQTTPFKKGIPAGWEQIKFGDFCTLKRGYDLPDALVEPGEFPVIAYTSIKTHHNQFKVEPPVVTTGRSGSLGTVLISNKKSWPLNTSLYVKDFKGNNPFLVFFTMKNMHLENFNAGAGVPSLNRNHLSALKMPCPPEDIQLKFDALIKPMFEEIWKLEEIITTLTRTKESLLPRLISGSLSVEELDIAFPPGMEKK